MKLSKSGPVNIEAVLKLIILLGFALFFYSTLSTGTVQLYVHPRLISYMKFGIVAMVLIALFIVPDVFKPKRRVNFIPYLLFIIPLLAAFALPAKAMDSKSMAFGDIKTVQQSKKAVQEGNNAGDNSSAANSAAAVNNNSLLQSSLQDPSQRLKLENDTIVMGGDNFVQWLNELYYDLDKYEGKKIEVVGFVLKNKKAANNEFMPARLTMTCCSADLQPTGLICRYDKASDLSADTWVKVTGTIKKVDYDGYKTPVIFADKVENTEKPKNEYVYPY